MNWKKELGKQIRDGREKRGLSQDELGAAAKMSRQSINLCENGRRGLSLPAFARLAFELNKVITISGYTIRVKKGRAGKRVSQQFCLPFGTVRTYSGAVLKMYPSKARLTIETTVKRVTF